MAGMAEIDLDPETGKVQVVDYVAVVDCGTVINTNLARVQTCLLYTSQYRRFLIGYSHELDLTNRLKTGLLAAALFF